MATDFRDKQLDLGAHKIPDDQNDSQKAARMDRLLSGQHAVLLPAWQAFEQDHANPKLLTEEYWTPHEERSIEKTLERPVLGAASDVSLPRLRNVIYARLGLKDGRVVAIYDGKSGRGAQRTAKHKATQAQWEIVGLDKAPFHYRIMGRRG